MLLPKQNKYMLLFVSPRNPLWHDLLGRKNCTHTEIMNFMKIGHGTLPSWRRGRPIKLETVRDALNEARAKIDELELGKKDGLKLATERAAECRARIDKFEAAYKDQAEHLYVIAEKILTMSIEDAQQVIDEAIYDRLPLFSTMFYGTPDRKEADAQEDFDKLKGVYEVVIQRYNIWLRCPLRVRYPIKIRDGVALRCKLNAPIMEPNSMRYWEYDGFVAVKSHAIFWVFEKRDPRRSDYFSFITCLGGTFEERFTLSGTYLTTGQDRLQSVATGDILLRQIPGKSTDDMEAIMHNGFGVLRTPAECEKLSDLMTRFRDRPIGHSAY